MISLINFFDKNLTGLKAILYIFSRVMIVAFIFFILFFSIPETSFTFKSPQTKMVGMTLIPEGWAFFTRYPRETDFVYYKVENNLIIENANFPFSSSENLFGIKRIPKALSSELFIILNQLDSIKWQPTKSCSLGDINKLERKYISVSNPAKHSLIRDSICILSIDPIPWAWSAIMEENNNNGNCIFLIVK